MAFFVKMADSVIIDPKEIAMIALDGAATIITFKGNETPSRISYRDAEQAKEGFELIEKALVAL
jgi:hypothetical protein